MRDKKWCDFCFTVKIIITMYSTKRVGCSTFEGLLKLCSFVSTLFIITGRPARSAAMPVLFLLSSPKNRFFGLKGRHVAPINVNLARGSEPHVSSPRAKFHVHRGRSVGIQPPTLSKYRILRTNLPLGAAPLHNFNEILSVSTRL